MHQRVDVIRHYTPGQQFITFVVEVKHRFPGNFSNLWFAQMTFTNATIKILLQLRPLLTVVFNLQKMFPFAPPRFGHGIGEPKGDELDKAGKIAVR